MSVAKLERYNLGIAIDNDSDGLWCKHDSHLASVHHLEKRIAQLEAALQALWTETKLAGNDNARDYGWPKVREMVLAALPSTSGEK